ncbi:hypothetical protein U1Q18_000189 [Sarracenia purpurea var. burkii]
MHARHRSPGNGYRSSSMGIGGVALPSRISPESSIRGHGTYNSEYRNYNRGFGRGQPNPFQTAQPPPRRADIFMEAGRLATEYLVTKGLLPSNVLSGRWQNGSLKNQIGSFQGFRQQEGDSLHHPPEGRTSALARLGSAVDAGSGRRRFADEYNSAGSRSVRGRRKTGSLKNYGSGWGREMGRSGLWYAKARASPDLEDDDDSFSGYQEEQQFVNDAGNEEQMSRVSKLAPKIVGVGDSELTLEKSQFQDGTRTNESSSDIGKDLPPANDVELTERSDDTKLLNKETVELKDGTSSDQVEKKRDMEDPPIQHFAVEGDSINKNGGDLLSLCRFSKVPTKIRSSLITRGSKVDPVPNTEEGKKHDMPQEEKDCDTGRSIGSEIPIKDISVDGSSVDVSTNKISSKCLESDILEETPVMPAQEAGELGSMNTDRGKFVRSQSYSDRPFMNEQDSSEEPPGFGSCSSMTAERGEKRAAQHSDSRERTKKPREWIPSVVTQSDEFLHLSQLTSKKPTPQGGRSPANEVILSKNQERPVDMSLFGRVDTGSCIEYAKEKQLFPGSFKICDLNLMEASEMNENPDPDPPLIFSSVTENKKEATPVDVDLSISNNFNTSDKYGKHGADGKEVEVIDLENDSVQEDKAFNNSERKADTEFTGLESFPNHAQSTSDISDVRDGYGLMISEFLGNDISNCTPVPADLNSLHNDMALHNGEGILGDDESIYMSLGEIPISFLRVWEQPAHEYDKPF